MARAGMGAASDSRMTSPITSSTSSHVCPSCSRRWLWVHDPSVLYEIGRTPLAVKDEEPTAAAEERISDIRQEADVGYGASHGYSPGHGGPTGPGDAPAGGNQR